jgi:hypothetical protein
MAIGEIAGCFSVHLENTVARVKLHFKTAAFMDIEEQLRIPRLQYVLGSLAARTQRRKITLATAFLSLVLIPSLGSAAIYKCTAQDGGVTYTDVPCPEDTTTQYIDPAAPTWLNDSSQTLNTDPAFRDATSPSQPEIIATLCANDEFRVWLKAQRHFLPERDARTAKFIEISNLCRRALHLPNVGAPIPQIPLKRVLGQ